MVPWYKAEDRILRECLRFGSVEDEIVEGIA
jgi:hypothetical protein